jgi:hypothetical protein
MQEREERRQIDARGGAIERSEAERALSVDDEGPRKGDAAFLLRIVHAELAHDVTVGVAEDRKAQTELLSESARGFRGIDGERHESDAERRELLVATFQLRQLAETERSPIPSIKNQYLRSRGAKRLELARRTPLVRDAKVGDNAPERRRLFFVDHGVVSIACEGGRSVVAELGHGQSRVVRSSFSQAPVPESVFASA